MRIHKLKNRWLLPVFSAAVSTIASHGAVRVTFAEVNGDVVATWSGSFDLSGSYVDYYTVEYVSPGGLVKGEPVVFVFHSGPLGWFTADSFSGTLNPEFLSLIGAPNSVAISSTGDIVSIRQNFFEFPGLDDGIDPTGIIDLDSKVYSATFESETLASLGLDALIDNETLVWSSSNGNPDSVVSFIAVPGASSTPALDITGYSISPAADEITLTWTNTGTDNFIVKASQDLIDWSTIIASNITTADDENPEDSTQLTVTFPLTSPVQGLDKLFFRIEKQ